MLKLITRDTKFVAFTLNHLKSLSLVFIKGFVNNVAGFTSFLSLTWRKEVVAEDSLVITNDEENHNPQRLFSLLITLESLHLFTETPMLQ
jgi:hypothetical protein